MSDWMSDPETRAWAQRALDELVPMIGDSAVTALVVPEQAGLGDVKVAVELGMSILLGKPIILAVVPGRQVPASLAAVASRIIEFDDQDPARTAAALRAAVDEVLG